MQRPANFGFIAFYCMWCVIAKGAVAKGKNLYISRVLGKDSWPCSQWKPCKSIWRAVTLASHGDHVHLDGTNTDKDPYTCQSGTSRHPGIYINKSMSLAGSASPTPQIRCSEGTGLTFDGSYNAEQMNVTLSGLLLNESFVIVRDSSVNINGCKFKDNKQGVQIVVRTSMIFSIQITNSIFSRNSGCISVVVNGGKSQSQYIKVMFKLMNSSFDGNVLSDQSSCISFTESPHNKQSVSYDISLENVAFSNNKFSSKGLVFLEICYGNQNINFQNVTLIDNRPLSGRDVLSGDGDSECIVRSTDVNIFIDSSNFTSNLARSFDVNASNILLHIYNSNFVGHKVQGSGGVLFLGGTDICRLNVSKSSFVNTSAAQGGAVSIECASPDTVSFKENIFKDNIARNGEGGALYIYSPRLLSNNSQHSTHKDKVECSIQGDKLLQINITKCDFTNAFSFSGGGGIHIRGVRVSIRLQHSAFINCTSTAVNYGGGGVFINMSLTSIPKRKSAGNNLLLFVEDSRFIGCSVPPSSKGGSLSVLFKTQIQINIKNSSFISSFGGAVAIQHLSKYAPKRVSYVKIEHSTFLYNRYSSPVRVFLYNRCIITLKNVTMESSIGVLQASADIGFDCTVRIHQSRFLKNRSVRGALTVSFSKLEVQDSLFDGNIAEEFGGAIHLYSYYASSFLSIAIFNTTFSNCSAAYAGGAICIHSDQQILKLEIQKSRFVNNSVFSYIDHDEPGYGGAIMVFAAPDTEVMSGCSRQYLSKSCYNDSAKKFRSWNYTSQVIFEDTTFERNTAGVGGAVFLVEGKATFRNCCFIDNFASKKGGHIYTWPGSTSLVMHDGVFRQTTNELPLLKVTSFLHAESSGALVFHNTTMDAAQPYDSAMYSPLVLVQNGGLIDLGDNNLTKFNCPLGSKMEITKFTTCQMRKINSTCEITINTRYLQYKCLRCTEDKYSLQRGSAFGGHLVPGFQCLPCPFGANCSKNIKAKPNFWGFLNKTVNPPTLTFTLCPLGYCSPPQKTDAHDYNGCQGNRSGELCGHCDVAYTETLYSTNCRLSHNCKDYWYWPIAFAYVSFMAFYFICRPPIVPWIKRQIFWFYKQETMNNNDDFDRGYLKIIFNFYQASNVLIISNTSGEIFKTKFVDIFVGLFNFQQKFSSNGLICPFPGLTMVTKQLLSATHVFGTCLMILAFYCFHSRVQKCRGRGAPSVGPYIGGSLQTMLLGYTTIASVSLKLLWCVPIGSEKRLFYDGNVVCFQWWQYILIAFVCSFVVPFVLILFWGALKLYRGTIPVEKFLLACCLPLPYLLNWAFLSLFCTTRNAAREDLPSSQVSRTSVERVLYNSFKRPDDGRKLALTWESVMIGRRLVLIVLKAFISDPLPRLLTMSFFCVLFLLHHALTQPFRDGIANSAETVSLLSIVLLATVNVFFASFLSLAVPFKNHFTSWWNFCQVVEIVILTAVPAIFCLLVIAAVLSQMCRLIVVVGRFLCNSFWFCFSWSYRKRDDEMRPLLAKPGTQTDDSG